MGGAGRGGSNPQTRAYLSSARLSIKRAPLGWVRGGGGVGAGSVQGRCRVGAGSVQGRGRVGAWGGGWGGVLGLYLIFEVGLIEMDN